MNRKNLPLLLMLTAGVVTCIVTFVQRAPVLTRLVTLFVVMAAFWLLGYIFKWMLDIFDLQNEERLKEEGEVIEKEAEDSGEQDAKEPGKQEGSGEE